MTLMRASTLDGHSNSSRSKMESVDRWRRRMEKAGTHVRIALTLRRMRTAYQATKRRHAVGRTKRVMSAGPLPWQRRQLRATVASTR